MKFITFFAAAASVAAQDLDFSTESLREAFGTGECRGINRGSPIDIKSADTVKDKYLPSLKVDGDWKGRVTGFQNRGQSLKFVPDTAVGQWTDLPVIKAIDGVTKCDYKLTDFEYLPNDSWHTISGSRSRAELVLNFSPVDGSCDMFQLPVLAPPGVTNKNSAANVPDHSTPSRIAMAILIKTGDQNPSLERVATATNGIKDAVKPVAAPTAEVAAFDINNFLKASDWLEEYYIYHGSALPTTSDATCAQDTMWIIQHNKAEAKRADIEAFHSYKQAGGKDWKSLKNMHAEREDKGARNVIKSFSSGGGGFSFWG